jgi:hypothetical protein
MHSVKRTIASLAIAALVLPGCTSMRPIKEDQAIGDRVKVGDKVELIDKAGYISTFTVGKVTPVDIAGTAENGRNVTIAIEDIETIKVEQIDGAKTTLAVAGGLVAVPIIIAGGFVFLLAACQTSC